MTLKFNGIRAALKVHVRAKFHLARCSGSRVIVVTEKNQTKTMQSVASARAVSNGIRT